MEFDRLYQRWLTHAVEDPDLQEELRSIEGKEAEIKDRFVLSVIAEFRIEAYKHTVVFFFFNSVEQLAVQYVFHIFTVRLNICADSGNVIRKVKIGFKNIIKKCSIEVKKIDIS